MGFVSLGVEFMKSSVKVGDVFYPNQGGSCTVVECLKNSKIVLEFNDAYKYNGVFETSNLLKGKVNNPYFPNVLGLGFIGLGKFKTAISGVRTKEYYAWSNMMQRSYSKEYKVKNKQYETCHVCEDWHNFQVFAEWYTNHEFYNKGYELDKDLLVKGNKVYSPETCTLIPKSVNMLITTKHNKVSNLPTGVRKSKNNKFSASVSAFGERKHLGYYESAGIAKKVYSEYKKCCVKLSAEEYKGRIDEKTYQALLNWSV